MRRFNITYVRHAEVGYCKGNAIGLERLSCENGRLIGDVCLSSGCWIYKESDMCPVQDIEVVIDWFSDVIWGAIKMTNSPVGGASEFSCPPESVDQGMCRAGTFCYKQMLNVLVEERVLGGRLWRSAWNSFPRGKRVCKRSCCKHCFSIFDSVCLLFCLKCLQFSAMDP